MLKKAYSDVEQAISELINDDVNYPANKVDTAGPVPVQRGFNYKDVGSNGNIPANTEKFCYLFTQKLNTIGTVSCAAPDTGLSTFKTSDGLTWWMKGDFNITNPPTPTFAIVVDVNGDKGPNCGFEGADNCATNHPNDVDTFIIAIRYDGQITMDDAGAAILADPTNNKK